MAGRLALEVEEELGPHAVVVLDEPHEELVMVRVRETAKGALFYLGEALMTSCRVTVEGAVGYGMVLGSARCLARELAVVDAVLAGPHAPMFAQRWEATLRRAEQARRDAWALRARRAEGTRVSFDTMKVDL